MKVKILSVLIIVLFLSIMLSGCNERKTNNDNSNDNLVTKIIPTITSFTVNPNTIKNGESALLNWIVDNAASVSIDNGIGNVEIIGNHLISPTQTTVYTITATNQEKQTTATTQIIVEPSDEEIEQLNEQVDSLLSAVEERDGFSASISISKTEFFVGEPSDINGLDYDCEFHISMGKNPKIFQVLGFYKKDNVNTFSGGVSYSEGSLASGGYCGSWKAQPTGEYYLYNGIYDATKVEETLNKNRNEITAKEIFLNIQPEVFSREIITVFEES